MNIIKKHSNKLFITFTLASTAIFIVNGCDFSEEDERALHAVQMHAGSVTGVAFSSDGKTLASASEDDIVRLLDVTDFHKNFESPTSVVALPKELPISPLIGFGTGFGSVSFSPDATKLAAGNFLPAVGGVVQLWDLESGKKVSTLIGQDSRVESIAFHPEGKTLASSSGGPLEFGDVALWNLESKQQINVFGRVMGGVGSVAFSPDGALVASASGSESVQLWQSDNGTLSSALTEDSVIHRSFAAAFSPNGALLASCGDDQGFSSYGRKGIVRIWEVLTGELIHSFDLSRAPLYAIDFSPNGTMLAVAGDDHVIYLVDIQTYELIHTLKGHTGRINSIQFSSNGQLIASGSEDRYMRLWYVGDLVGQTCNDGIDNDGDGWLDIKDPDCADGETETGFGYTECNDDFDNDQDGYKDAADPDCRDGFDDTEAFGEDDPDGGIDGGDDTDDDDTDDTDPPDSGVDTDQADSGEADSGEADSGNLDGGN